MQEMSPSDAVPVGDEPRMTFRRRSEVQVFARNARETVKVNKVNILGSVEGRVQR